MSTNKILLAFAIAAGVAVGSVDAATAQGMQGTMGRGMMQGGMGREMMSGGARPGSGDMGQCRMGGMGSRMGQRMGRSGMMGMMGSRAMPSGTTSGMSALFGSRVTPVMNLSVDEVREYLALQLENLSNKRLKIGDVKAEEVTITADIVTVDNSLVQQLKVDRHTGTIEYEN